MRIGGSNGPKTKRKGGTAAENGLMISSFVKDGKKRYYAVNLSTVCQNNIELKLSRGEYEIFRGEETLKASENVKLTLREGEGVYIKSV